MSKITETRLLHLIEVYGANPNAWPAGEREGAKALLATSEMARRAAHEAEALDGLLNTDRVAPADLALRMRIAEIPVERPSNWRAHLRALWPFETLWQPATGLVAAAVFGVLVGGGPLSDTLVGAPDGEIATGDFAYTIIASAGGDIEESLQ